MQPRFLDGPTWVDTALQYASRRPGIDQIQVRLEEQFDERHILSPAANHGTGHGYVGGIGIRIRSGNGRGYAFTNHVEASAIQACIDRALGLAQADHRHATLIRPEEPPLPRERLGHAAPTEAGRIDALLARCRDRFLDERPQGRLTTAYGVRHARSILADAEGGWLESRHDTSTLYLQATEKDGARAGDATAWNGGTLTLDDHLAGDAPEALAMLTAERLAESLVARTVRPGRHRTLADGELSGLLAHESFGHLTESDLVRSGWSVLQGRLGDRLAAHGVTIRDAPIAPDPATGVQVPYDQEGTPGRTVTMLDDGVLTSYLHDRDSAGLQDQGATGNARALNVHHAPLVRMRNTYIDRGELQLEEALEALGDGYYLQGGRGGSPRADGSFMFTADRGYLVEKGQIVAPVKMCSIYGNVLDFLANVEGATRDLRMYTNYFGGCGKWDQAYLHVGTGGPDVLVSEALIGGQDGPVMSP